MKNTRICHFFGLTQFGLLLLTLVLCNKCTASQVLEFTLEPSDTVVPEGGSVLLQCAGQTNKKLSHVKDGKISPNIRWRGSDGQDIGIDTFRVQLTNGSLYISSVNENRGLTGNYQCLLSVDGVGTIVSRTARVSIASKPEVNQESNENYLDLGQTSYIKCMTSQKLMMNINDKNYKIHWFKDDMPLRFDNTRMVVLPTGSLEIDELTLQDRGTYQCNVSYDNYSRVSSKTNLNIRSPSGNPESFAPPTFIVVPSTQTVREGDQVILECGANGNPRPKITWLRNGVDIDFNDLDSRFRIVGTGSLQITAIEEGDSGDYQCRTSNSIESLDASATLNVHISPKFLQAPSDKIANEKDELELTCSIYGKPPPVIQWLKNGDLITPNDYMQITGGHNLKILGLIPSDAGMFQCVGMNPAGSVQASAFLEVLHLGSSKKHKSKKIQSSLTTTKKPLSSAAITTKKPTKFDLKSMTTTKNQKQLANDFSKQALDSLLSRNKNSQFSADASDYVDRLNDNQHTDFDEDEEEDYDDEDDEGTIHQIQPGTDPKKLLHALENAKNHDFNTDDVSHFSNSRANFPVTRKPHLSEDSKPPSVLLPGPPRAVQAQIIKPRFVTLNWLEPKENPDEVVSYTIYYKMNAADARERKLKTNSRDEQEVNVQGLSPGKTYHIRVVAMSNYGPGESSQILEIATLPEENMAGPPENFRGAAMSHDEIFLQWDAPRESNGAIQKYRVYFAEGDNGEDQTADTTSNEFMLTQLRAYCEYTISVVAFNQNGMGNPSQEILLKTFSNTPSDPPSNFSVEASSSTSISLRWEPPPPEHQNGPITGYKIHYRKIKNSVKKETTPGNVKFYELINLDKMSAYQIKIAAMTINGTGPFSDWQNVDTYENDLDETQVPGEPGWIRTKPMANSILVTWGPPAQAEIKVRAYFIGWGKGIPDESTHELDENSRQYEIRDLEPNSEYVIALRARNSKGDGAPKYDNTRTREDLGNEPSQPLQVPVGLRAIPMSGSSIVVYWSDTTLGKSQHVTDNRFYTVRYSSTGSTRYRYHNTSILNCMISDLKPSTTYEFEVKVVKGRRESSWSMSVLNTTMSALPASPPRDLKVSILDDKSPLSAHLTWAPPKHFNTQILNYVILYTTDSERRDREWAAENVPADKTSVIVNQLSPHTTYYFKVQTNHGKTKGPFSAMVSIRTGAPALSTDMSASSNILLTTELFYALIGGMILLVLIIIAVVSMIFCKKKPQETPEHKKSYQKNPGGVIKPPDLWIHHDQIELKNTDKTAILHHHQTTPGCSDGASSSGAMTLPRSVGHDFETDSQFPSHVTNSLDKRTYVPGYMTNSMSSSASDRPQYPRTQYNRPPHLSTMDPSLSQQNIPGGSIIHSPENPYAYDVVPTNYSNPNMVYAAGGIPLELAKQRGHPLKSFSIPAPPSNTPLIPGQKPVPAITIRPSQSSSPYKKSGTTTPSSSNRLQTGQLVPHSSDEVQALRPSTSTEELNQEMANLEGLMKDLSAITASEFEC